MSAVIIGARFAGRSIVHTPDGTFEAVLPELTEFEEGLQAVMIAKHRPTPKLKAISREREAA